MTPFHYQSFIKGAYTDVGIMSVPSDPQTGCGLYIADNVNTSYKMGSILKRVGYENIGEALQANKPITGLHNFRQSAATQKMLATVNNAGDTATQLLYSTGGAWTAIGAAATAWDTYEDTKVEMEDFIGYCFMVCYDATDNVWLPNATLTGTTFGTTNTTSMPQAKYIKRYRDRLYVANCYETSARPYRVYFSSVPSAGTITWTVATDYIDVDYSEGITGIGENFDRLMVFTEYSCYFYNQSEWRKVFDVGCSAHRTIKNLGGNTLWANRDGVFMSNGGRPENIAGRVIDFIRYANMTNAFAEVVDEEYHLYLGAVTVNGVSYSNLALIFNLATQSWRWHEYYDSLTVFGKFYSAGEDYLYMGASDGDVHRLGKYTDTTLLVTDDGAPINSWFQLGCLDFGDPTIVKKLGKVYAFADRAQGLKLRARIITKNTLAITPWKPLCEITGYITEGQINPDQGNLLQVEGSENGSNPYWSLFQFSVLVDISQPTKK
jgi:hypothetical protein